MLYFVVKIGLCWCYAGVQWCVEGGNLVAKHNYRQRQGQGGRAGWQGRVAAKIEEHNSAVKQQILDTLVRTPLLIGLLPAPICLIKPRLIAISEKISFCHSVLTNSLPVICSNESSQIGLLPWFLLPTINDNYQRFYRFRKKPIDLKFPFFSPRQQPQDQSRSEC